MAKKLSTSVGPSEWSAEPAIGLDIALDGRIPEVQVWGEIDVSNAEVLRDQLMALAGKDGDVVVDLSGVEFFGVAGLDALCAAARRFGEEDDRLLVRAPPAVTRRVIEVLGLDGLLPVISEGPFGPN